MSCRHRSHVNSKYDLAREPCWADEWSNNHYYENESTGALQGYTSPVPRTQKIRGLAAHYKGYDANKMYEGFNGDDVVGAAGADTIDKAMEDRLANMQTNEIPAPAPDTTITVPAPPTPGTTDGPVTVVPPDTADVMDVATANVVGAPVSGPKPADVPIPTPPGTTAPPVAPSPAVEPGLPTGNGFMKASCAINYNQLRLVNDRLTGMESNVERLRNRRKRLMHVKKQCEDAGVYELKYGANGDLEKTPVNGARAVNGEEVVDTETADLTAKLGAALDALKALKRDVKDKRTEIKGLTGKRRQDARKIINLMEEEIAKVQKEHDELKKRLESHMGKKAVPTVMPGEESPMPANGMPANGMPVPADFTPANGDTVIAAPDNGAGVIPKTAEKVMEAAANDVIQPTGGMETTATDVPNTVENFANFVRETNLVSIDGMYTNPKTGRQRSIREIGNHPEAAKIVSDLTEAQKIFKRTEEGTGPITDEEMIMLETLNMRVRKFPFLPILRIFYPHTLNNLTKYHPFGEKQEKLINREDFEKYKTRKIRTVAAAGTVSPDGANANAIEGFSQNGLYTLHTREHFNGDPRRGDPGIIYGFNKCDLGLRRHEGRIPYNPPTRFRGPPKPTHYSDHINSGNLSEWAKQGQPIEEGFGLENVDNSTRNVILILVALVVLYFYFNPQELDNLMRMME